MDLGFLGNLSSPILTNVRFVANLLFLEIPSNGITYSHFLLPGVHLLCRSYIGKNTDRTIVLQIFDASALCGHLFDFPTLIYRSADLLLLFQCSRTFVIFRENFGYDNKLFTALFNTQKFFEQNRRKSISLF